MDTHKQNIITDLLAQDTVDPLEELLGPYASTSVLDRQINLSKFPDVLAQSVAVERLTIRQLADVIRNTQGDSKSDLPLLKLATFGTLRTEAGSLRHNGNLQWISGIEGDYDAGQVGPDDAADRLRRAGVAAVIYTTPSHTDDAPRWRVLCPLSRPATPSDRDDLCARVNAALGGILAQESFSQSQPYYYGGIAGQPSPAVHLVEGSAIDLKTDLPRIGKPSRSVSTLEADLSELDWTRIRSALEAVPGDGADYHTWREIGMALHSAAGGSDEAFTTWCDWGRQHPDFKEREHQDKWKSFKGQGIGIGTLFHIAKVHGWTPPVRVWGPEDFDDLPALPEAEMLIMHQKNGDPRPNLNNAIAFLIRVNRDQGFSIRRNSMTGQDEWRAGPINDADLDLIRVAIEQAGMHNVGSDLTAGAVRSVAMKNQYHPVRDWLSALPPHDGRPRLDGWLTDYMGAEATPYTRAVGRAFLVAMVARVMRPGCKHDHVLVLGGSQGIGKSTACQILGGAWAGDNMPSIRDGAKEAGLYLNGHWLVELAELAPSRKAEAEDLKAFLSRSTDEIRAPYARRADVLPRQCVFVGTTNESAFLKDATGGRRFWPVTCGAKIETEALARDREQLFAEALAAFEAGETWHLTPEMERQAGIEQEAAREEHPWEGPIKGFLDGNGTLERLPRDRVTVSEVLTMLGIPTAQHTSGNARQVGSILRLLGWQRKPTNAFKVWVRQ